MSEADDSWVSAVVARRVLGCTLKTLRRCVSLGELDHKYVHHRHYTDTAPRKTTRGRMYISVSSIERLLEQVWSGLRVGGKIKPRALRRNTKGRVSQ